MFFNSVPCFSKMLLTGEFLKLTWFITRLSSEGSISSPVKYSFLSIFSDDKADIFAASLLISHCNFPSLTVSSIVMTSFYILFTT